MHFAELTNFSQAFQWVISNGYPLMFVAMLIEGPIVTAAAAFAVAFGYFNIFNVFVLSILGDVVADVVYYTIGYFSRVAVIERWGHYFGLTDQRMKKIESLLNNHPIKTLIVLKITPILPTPGLMIVGTTKMSLKRFVTVCSLITLPKTILFMVAGYYFGQAYDIMMQSFKQEGLVVVFIIAILLVVRYAFNKFSAYIATKVEKI